eukprot:GHVU01197211.1.p1 GENE.GHVU01197211.1~~GHVU01197211.1.p1  ORF type:complete len:219 (+),score=14.57 GHVU01197211.1:45-701(+)
MSSFAALPTSPFPPFLPHTPPPHHRPCSSSYSPLVLLHPSFPVHPGCPKMHPAGAAVRPPHCMHACMSPVKRALEAETGTPSLAIHPHLPPMFSSDFFIPRWGGHFSLTVAQLSAATPIVPAGQRKDEGDEEGGSDRDRQVGRQIDAYRWWVFRGFRAPSCYRRQNGPHVAKTSFVESPPRCPLTDADDDDDENNKNIHSGQRQSRCVCAQIPRWKSR